MHFSRNPKIALYMRNHKLVKEFGKGVDRMFREMAEAGLPAPEYKQNEFMVYATIRQAKDAAGQVSGNGDVNGELNGQLNGPVNGPVSGLVNGPVNSLKGSLKEVYLIVLNNPGVKIGQVAKLRGKSESTVKKQLTVLRKINLIEYRGSDKTGGYYMR